MTGHRAFEFWKTLGQVVRMSSAVSKTLDIPLAEATVRSKWAACWTVLVIAIAVLVRDPHVVSNLLSETHAPLQIHGFLEALVTIMLVLLALPVAYGFLRMYTLVHQVMVVNVFKCRGQRLRLLNFYSTVLPLSVPLVIAYDLVPVLPWFSALLDYASVLYLIQLHSTAYNVIFHKRRLGGFGLFVGGTLVTWFVLCIGTGAIAVAFAVISFFILALLRVFTHH